MVAGSIPDEVIEFFYVPNKTDGGPHNQNIQKQLE
jgi:hypothetical protein